MFNIDKTEENSLLTNNVNWRIWVSDASVLAHDIPISHSLTSPFTLKSKLGRTYVFLFIASYFRQPFKKWNNYINKEFDNTTKNSNCIRTALRVLKKSC